MARRFPSGLRHTAMVPRTRGRPSHQTPRRRLDGVAGQRDSVCAPLWHPTGHHHTPLKSEVPDFGRISSNLSCAMSQCEGAALTDGPFI